MTATAPGTPKDCGGHPWGFARPRALEKGLRSQDRVNQGLRGV